MTVNVCIFASLIFEIIVRSSYVFNSEVLFANLVQKITCYCLNAIAVLLGLPCVIAVSLCAHLLLTFQHENGS